MTDVVTTPMVREALRARFAPPAFAYLSEVGNATGSNVRRHADAIAMSLYPSRGLEIHGVEIKVSRSDWLRELKDPEKSVAVQGYCHRWWIAVGRPDIVNADEVPVSWGLMVYAAGGMKVRKQAPLLEPKPISLSFVAAILRQASTQMPSEEAIAMAIQLGREDGQALAEKRMKTDQTVLASEYESLKRTVREFEERSGLRIESWTAGRLADQVKLARDVLSLEERRERVAREIRGLSASLTALGDAS